MRGPFLRRHRDKLAGRLHLYMQNWRRITHDADVLRIVQHGLTIELTSDVATARRGPQFRGSPEQMRHLAVTLRQWLDEGSIEIANLSQRVVLSLLFPVPKKVPGDWRWCLDARRVNARSAPTPHLKMFTVKELRQQLPRGAFMAKLDLANAYLTVGLERASRHLFGFEALGRVYMFRVLLFGLSCAPFWFTQIVKPIVALLHRRGVCCGAYLDDVIIWARSHLSAKRGVRLARRVFRRLGFIINAEKSVFLPSQRLEYLGFIWDTTSMTLAVPRSKRAKLRRCAQAVSLANSRGTLTIRQLASLAGLVTAMMPAMLAAWYRRHSLQRCVEFGLRRSRGSWDGLITLSRTALRDLRWLLSPAAWCASSRPLRTPRPSLILTTDASLTGMGATLESRSGAQWTTHGFWTPSEARMSSNARETLAVVRGFFAFKDIIRSASNGCLLIRSDNATAISAIRRLGSRWAHLGQIVEPLLRAVFRWRLIIEIVHIPGELNQAADLLSRLSPDRNQWGLRPEVLLRLLDRWPHFRPTIDLMASHAMHLHHRYASRHRDAKASIVDCFTMPSWAAERPIIVPPINLIPRVLGRLLDDAPSAALMITPWWPSRSWTATLLAMCKDLVLLPPSAIHSVLPLLKDGTSPVMAAWLL